jgi:hypothetical protein
VITPELDGRVNHRHRADRQITLKTGLGIEFLVATWVEDDGRLADGRRLVEPGTIEGQTDQSSIHKKNCVRLQTSP